MRTIKFRGKSKESGEWVYGYFCRSGRGTPIIIVPNNEDEPFDHIEVLPESVGQYITNDGTGKETYEGDIAVFEINKDKKITNKNVVRLENGYWKPIVLALEGGNAFRVVGNITDNTELLKNDQ